MGGTRASSTPRTDANGSQSRSTRRTIGALSWEEFFERFDRESLAFAYDPDGNGDATATAKLVSR